MEAACFSGQRARGQVPYADDGPETFRQKRQSYKIFLCWLRRLADFRLAQAQAPCSRGPGSVVRVPAAVASVVRGVPGMEITHKRRRRLQAVAVQFLLGIAGLVLITFVCFQLSLGVARTGFAYVIFVALVSLLGSFSASVVLSVLAAACLEYFFAPPLFELRIDLPEDIERIAAFLTTSLVVTALITKLRASEQRFRSFVDHATDAFFLLDDESAVLDVNRQACVGLGYSKEELIGKHTSDFDVGLDEASIQSLKQRIVTGETITFETRHRRKDGTSFPVEVRVGQFEQGGRRFLCLVRDITERKRAEDALRDSEERFRTLVQFSFDVYWESDAHIASPVRCSPRVSRMRRRPALRSVRRAGRCLTWSLTKRLGASTGRHSMLTCRFGISSSRGPRPTVASAMYPSQGSRCSTVRDALPVTAA